MKKFQETLVKDNIQVDVVFFGDKDGGDLHVRSFHDGAVDAQVIGKNLNLDAVLKFAKFADTFVFNGVEACTKRLLEKLKPNVDEITAILAALPEAEREKVRKLLAAK